MLYTARVQFVITFVVSNIALIIAGGVGSRMGYEIPKQFIKVYDKPVLLYTLESFQKHEMVDSIVCVCIQGWEEELMRYVEFYHISKLVKIVPGGASGQESIRNGVFAINEFARPDDNIIIHDGIRPMVDDYVLTDVLNVCSSKGNAVPSLPCNEQIFLIDSQEPTSTTKYIPRETLRRVSTPQAYKLHKLVWAYTKAFEEKIGIYGSSYTNTMMVELGERLNFAAGSDKNIKLTTQDDLELFKGYLNAK